MKVYISVDMEGIACVTQADHTKLEGFAYQAARKWTTAEANAAIQGAFEAGAQDVVVADAHGSMHNLIPDDLHKDITLVQGIPRPLAMMGGLDGTFDAALFIGYHAGAGNPSGVLAHSFSDSMREVRLNQEPVNEALFNAAIAGHLDVPVVLVSGDDQLKDEIEVKMPWVECVVTKWSLSRTSARNLTPKASQEKIRAAAFAALKNLAQAQPYIVSKPTTMEVDFARPVMALLVSDIPGIERTSGVTVRFEAKDMLEATRIFRLMSNASMSKYPV